MERKENVEMQAVAKRIRGNPELYKPFPMVPQAQEWLQLFKKDAMRYPLLLVQGHSHTGKTEWAKSLFANPLELKVGKLEHFPDDMRAFTRGVHDGVILDDVRNLKFLVDHQEKLQGKYAPALEFASTQGGMCAYKKWLFAVPTVATFNFSTAGLELLVNDDFLGNPSNRVLVSWPPAQFYVQQAFGHTFL